MLGPEPNQILSIDELISELEHIELSEISSDIRANVRAELKRIKRNVSLVLAFISNPQLSRLPADHELVDAITHVKGECLRINAAVSRALILQTLRADKWTDYSARINEQYGAMTEALRGWCAIAAPLRVEELARAL